MKNRRPLLLGIGRQSLETLLDGEPKLAAHVHVVGAAVGQMEDVRHATLGEVLLLVFALAREDEIERGNHRLARCRTAAR